MHHDAQFLKSLAFVNETLMINQSSYPSSCFSRPFHVQRVCPGVRSLLVTLLIEAVLPRALFFAEAYMKL